MAIKKMKGLVVLMLICIGANHVFCKSNKISKLLIDLTMKSLESVVNRTECTKQLHILWHDLDNKKAWSFQMIESSATFGPGVLTGHYMFIGNYDKCLNVNVYRHGSRIRGQYCRATVKPSARLSTCIRQGLMDKGITGVGKTPLATLKDVAPISFDVCTPQDCTPNDLQNIWTFLKDQYNLEVDLSFDEDFCRSKEKYRQFYLMDYIAFTFFGFLGILVFLSTVYDVLTIYKYRGNQIKWLAAFSFYTNGKQIFSLKEPKDGMFTCFCGIRVISIMWVIVGHRCTVSYYTTAVNSFYQLKLYTYDVNMYIVGGTSAVDTFFVMSGFLIAYTMMTANEIGKRIQLTIFYFHRILRLVPSLAAMILLYVGIVRHLGSGPYWMMVENGLVKNCYNNWWATILFVENYASPDALKACIPQAWYLSVDFQLYLLSPLLFIPLLKWPKQAIALIVGLVLACTAAIMHASILYGSSDRSLLSLMNYARYIYLPTHLRATPWLIGILLGYFMFISKTGKSYVILVWGLCVVIMLGCLHTSIALMKYKLPMQAHALIHGLIRSVWALCISWIIFACSRGYGGFINKFLSLPVFRLLSRFTFSIYLSHFLIINLIDGQRGSTPYMTNLSAVHKVWGDFVFSLGFSIIWTLIFESPIKLLENAMQKK